LAVMTWLAFILLFSLSRVWTGRPGLSRLRLR
jgi:hypothetical protein